MPLVAICTPLYNYLIKIIILKFLFPKSALFKINRDNHSLHTESGKILNLAESDARS